MCILAGIYKEQVQKNIISSLALYSFKKKKTGLDKSTSRLALGQWDSGRAGKCPGLIARGK